MCADAFNCRNVLRIGGNVKQNSCYVYGDQITYNYVGTVGTCPLVIFFLTQNFSGNRCGRLFKGDTGAKGLNYENIQCKASRDRNRVVCYRCQRVRSR